MRKTVEHIGIFCVPSIVETEHRALISIRETFRVGEREKRIYKYIDQTWKKMISLGFDDIRPEPDKNEIPLAFENEVSLTLFNEDHARKTIDFLKEINRNPIHEELFVHCHAGVSRSAAVAIFASEKFGYSLIGDPTGHNKYVLGVLNQVWNS